MKRRGCSPSAPKYRLHKSSGQARVTINSKTHYLGKYGTDESKGKYHRLIAELWHPPGSEPKPITPAEVDKTGEAVTVSLLAIEFAKFAQKKYGETNEWNQIRIVLKEIRAMYGDLLARDFGPIRYDQYRQSLIERGLSRPVVKRKAGYVRRMFQHGVKYELITVDLYQRLLAVGPVDMDYEPQKIGPADLKIVRATQEQLTPVVRDLVEVQLLTGMRPGEACNLRPCDIDRTGDVWIYKPPKHKTRRYGKDRIVTIGPKAQQVLAPYLLRDHNAFCFTPREAYEQYLERRRENRITPQGYGNGPRPRKPKSFKPRYDKDSYRRAIDRAAKRAFPVPKEIKGDPDAVKAWKKKHVWKPNQLRHTAATLARQTHDLETAQNVLGHSSKRTTEKFYAEQDISRSIEFARKHG